MKTLLPMILIMTSHFALAGNEIGNGGDVIVCKKNAKINKVEFFDLFEGRERRGLKYNLGAANLPWEKKVEIILQRVRQISPQRAERYAGWFKTFISDSEFITSGKLIDIPDTGDGWIPPNCDIEQIVVRRDTHFPNEKIFLVSAELWNFLDNDNKAALVTHELILRELMTNEDHTHKSSVFARYFNEMVIADALSSYSLKQLFDFMLMLEMPTFEAHGFEFRLYLDFMGKTKNLKENFYFYDDNHLRGTSSKSVCSPIQILGQNVQGVASSFYPNGQAKSVSLECGEPVGSTLKFNNFNIVSSLTWTGRPGFLAQLTFGPNGDIQGFEGDNIRAEGPSFKLKVSGAAILHSNNSLASARVVPSVDEPNQILCGGVLRTIDPDKFQQAFYGADIFFDDVGKFLKIEIVDPQNPPVPFTNCADVVK